MAIEVKAASLGAKEKDLELIRKSIGPLLEFHMRKRVLMEWMNLQVKLACYRKASPPKYSEFLRLRLLTKQLKLDDGRNHTKEYLEKCMQFDRGLLTYEKVVPPNQYFKSLIKNEAGLPYHLKLRYADLDTKISPLKAAENVVLRFLPKFVPDMDDYTDKGKKFSELTQAVNQLDKQYQNGLSKVYLQYEQDEHDCKVM